MELEQAIKQSKFRSEYHKLIVNIIFTANMLNSINTSLFKPLGISPQQYNILRILRGQHPNPATVNLLKERMLDKMSNASRLVEKLRVKELLKRQASARDRRAVDVVITKKGLALLDELDILIEEQEIRHKTLTVKEAQNMNLLLDKFRG